MTHTPPKPPYGLLSALTGAMALNLWCAFSATLSGAHLVLRVFNGAAALYCVYAAVCVVRSWRKTVAMFREFDAIKSAFDRAKAAGSEEDRKAALREFDELAARGRWH